MYVGMATFAIPIYLSLTMDKIHRLSSVTEPTQHIADSVRRERLRMDDRMRGINILMMAQRAYAAMDHFRRDRDRNKRYTYGDQWGDRIKVDGKWMTEGEYLNKQGCPPLKNNHIRKLVRSVVGVWTQQQTEPTCIARDRDEQRLGEVMSTTLQYNMQVNRMQSSIYPRALEEFLISGLIVHKKRCFMHEGREDCWTEVPQPNNVFIDPDMRDFRGWDCRLIGEIHDISFDEMIKRFAHTPEESQRLAEVYGYARDLDGYNTAYKEFGYAVAPDGLSFLVPSDSSKCRVIEVWRKEIRPRYQVHDYNSGELYIIDASEYKEFVEDANKARIAMAARNGIPKEEVPLRVADWFVDDYWYYYYLTPYGDILAEGETPYAHRSHPYVFKGYPMIDGEIHSFVKDIIDQQRYVNRLVTLYDWTLRASAKGVLLMPQECIRDTDMDIDDIMDAWSTPNGVIIYSASPTGAKPEQVAANSVNVGMAELLNLQLKFFEDISGVTGSLQGKQEFAGQSAAMFNQQTQNSVVSLADIMETFNDFVRDAAVKDVKNIQQFYDSEKEVKIAGKSASVVYDPEEIKDIEFDLSIVPSTSTPAYRAIANNFLMQLWSAGQVTLEQMLQVGDFPFADELMQVIQSQGQQLAQGQTPDGLPPELQQQVQQGANMEAVNALRNGMRDKGEPFQLPSQATA